MWRPRSGAGTGHRSSGRSGRARSSSGNRREVATTRTSMIPAASTSTARRSRGPPIGETSAAAARPPSANPTEKPAATRGKWAFIWRTSRRRPACEPTRTNPMGIDNGNRTRSGNVTQSPSSPTSDEPAGSDGDEVGPHDPHGDPGEGEPSLGTRHGRRHGDPRRRDGEIHVGKRHRAVLVQEQRTRGHDEEGHGQAQHDRLPPEQERGGISLVRPRLVRLTKPPDQIDDHSPRDLRAQPHGLVERCLAQPQAPAQG